MINRAKLAALAKLSLRCEPEDTDVRGNVLASGDDAIDREAEDEVIARLDRGDDWAWCIVIVEARYGGMVGRAVLGGNTYDDEKAFKADGYYTDMVSEALDDLASQLDTVASAVGAVSS